LKILNGPATVNGERFQLATGESLGRLKLR
jgi:hypothetical protein